MSFAEYSARDWGTGRGLLVALHVFPQMVRPHKPFPAVLTRKVPLVRVRPPVATELVAPRKPLVTALTVTHIRLLPGVRAHMRLEVGALVVGLVADVALEVSLPNRGVRSPQRK